jgi:hypothetical protein
MAYRPRQLVVRAREAAGLFVTTLDRQGLVSNFLNSYAREFNRAARTAHPGRYKELAATIRREALLAMAARLEAALPKRLGIRSLPPPHISERRSLDLFHQEFFIALGEAMDWGAEEFAEFWHDLELYRKLGARTARTAKSQKSAARVEGPFVDRAGLLLDPAMLEKARRAAAKFQAQLEATADALLKKVFSSRHAN